MKKIPPILFVFVLIISACSANHQPSITGSWKLISYGSINSQQPAVPNSDAVITFDSDGRLNGNSGCNSIGGDYKVSGDTITFGPIMSTMMACADPQMTQESAVVQTLTNTASFKVDGSTLTIANKDMMLVFTLVAGK